MSKKDLDKFLDKICQLNAIVELINKSPIKKEQLIKCIDHEEVIELTKSWGFNIGERWGENKQITVKNNIKY